MLHISTIFSSLFPRRITTRFEVPVGENTLALFCSKEYISAKTLTCLLEKVLKLNNFTFNDQNLIQVKGTSF